MLPTAKHHDLTVRFGGPLSWPQWPNSAGLGAALASIEIHKSPLLKELPGKLRENLAYFDSRFKTAETGDNSSIRLVVIGDEMLTSEISGEIFRCGFYTSPVFFPVAGKGKAGLRVMIRADNNREDLAAFCDAVEELNGRREGAEAVA